MCIKHIGVVLSLMVKQKNLFKDFNYIIDPKKWTVNFKGKLPACEFQKNFKSENKNKNKNTVVEMPYTLRNRNKPNGNFFCCFPKKNKNFRRSFLSKIITALQIIGKFLQI